MENAAAQLDDDVDDGATEEVGFTSVHATPLLTSYSNANVRWHGSGVCGESGSSSPPLVFWTGIVGHPPSSRANPGIGEREWPAIAEGQGSALLRCL